MFLQSRVSASNGIFFVICVLELCSCTSENRRASDISPATTSPLKFWVRNEKASTPESSRRNYGTAMDGLKDYPTEEYELKRNEIDKKEKKSKKKKLTTKMKKSSKNRNLVFEIKNLKHRSHTSAEKNIRSDLSKESQHDFWEESDFENKFKAKFKTQSTKLFKQTKKRNKSKYENDSSLEKITKDKQVKYSSTEKQTKEKREKIYSAEKKNKVEEKARDEQYSSNEKQTKDKPRKYSTTEKKPKRKKGRQYQQGTEIKSHTNIGRKLSNGKNTQSGESSLETAVKRSRRMTYSTGKWTRRKQHTESSFENKKPEADSRTISDFKKDFGQIEQEVTAFGQYDPDSSDENTPIPTRSGIKSSRENINSLGAGDTEEEKVASDHSDEVNQYSRPYSSEHEEKQKKVKSTVKSKSRSKLRNPGREKYLYKLKKALRSTLMPEPEENPKDEDTTAGAGNSTRDLIDQYVLGDPYLNPYNLKTEMCEAAKNTVGVDSVVSEIVGRTAGYNNIIMLKLSGGKEGEGMRLRADARENKYLDEPPQKKIIFIVHGLTVYGMVKVDYLSRMRMFKQLLSYYAKHLDKFDIYLIPLANPDGFSYAQVVSLWSKNRSPQALCPGVQVDRNFEVAWKNPTKNSCDQHYPGPKPFSEAESRAVRDVFHKHGQRIIAFIDVHSSSEAPSIFKGDAVLYPKGFTESNEDTDRYLDLQGDIEEMMNNASFRHRTVRVATLRDWYGVVRGTSVDYASSVYGIPYALEFSMQPYPDRGLFHDQKPDYSKLALEQIWRRVIDVVFNNIHANRQDRVGFRH